jgi:hypothetical protein
LELFDMRAEMQSTKLRFGCAKHHIKDSRTEDLAIHNVPLRIGCTKAKQLPTKQPTARVRLMGISSVYGVPGTQRNEQCHAADRPPLIG